MFCAIALGALWNPLGVVSFCVCTLRVPQWSLKENQKVFKNHGLVIFGGPVLGDLFGLSSPRKRSHAAWRSFFVSPERSHAAWRSYIFAEPLICVRAKK